MNSYLNTCRNILRNEKHESTITCLILHRHSGIFTLIVCFVLMRICIVIVPTFDWTTFLGAFFRKVANMKKFHHFHFAEGSTTVRLQEFVDGAFLQESLARRKMSDDVTMPPVVHLKGLDAKRQWYLYDEIRRSQAEAEAA